MVPRPGRDFSGARNPFMQGLNANEVLESMLYDGFVVPVFGREEKEPEPQEQRVWELDDDYDSEEAKEKKKARNKKKYLRKKEKAQAEKAKLQPQQPERNDSLSETLADMSVQDEHAVKVAATTPTYAEAIATSTEPLPKLSKRQKKTLLKKAKRVQSTTSTSESASTSINCDAAADPHQSSKKSADLKAEAVKHDKGKDEGKSNGNGHEKQEDSKGDGHEKQEDGKAKDEEKKVATTFEVEAVMATVAKRFGQ